MKMFSSHLALDLINSIKVQNSFRPIFFKLTIEKQSSGNDKTNHRFSHPYMDKKNFHHFSSSLQFLCGRQKIFSESDLICNIINQGKNHRSRLYPKAYVRIGSFLPFCKHKHEIWWNRFQDVFHVQSFQGFSRYICS